MTTSFFTTITLGALLITSTLNATTPPVALECKRALGVNDSSFQQNTDGKLDTYADRYVVAQATSDLDSALLTCTQVPLELTRLCFPVAEAGANAMLDTLKANALAAKSNPTQKAEFLAKATQLSTAFNSGNIYCRTGLTPAQIKSRGFIRETAASILEYLNSTSTDTYAVWAAA